MPVVASFHGKEIARKFLQLLNWSRGGRLLIVTPFMNDFDIRGRYFSDRVRFLMRQQTELELITIAPEFHTTHEPPSAASTCWKCRGAGSKIRLLDIYRRTGARVLIQDRLHAKVYIGWNHDDHPMCLTGSVNLTRGGMSKWHELGLYIKDPESILRIRDIIVTWKKGVGGARAQRYLDWKRNAYKRSPHLAEAVRAVVS